MTLGEAIEELVRQYDKACCTYGIKHPLKDALFEVWKQADEEIRNAER